MDCLGSMAPVSRMAWWALRHERKGWKGQWCHVRCPSCGQRIWTTLRLVPPHGTEDPFLLEAWAEVERLVDRDRVFGELEAPEAL